MLGLQRSNEYPAWITGCKSLIRRRTLNKKGQHVVPRGGKWAVRKAGSARASSTHETQREAIDAARSAARNQGTELYIHGRDGRIRERSTFGKDPFPPKG